MNDAVFRREYAKELRRRGVPFWTIGKSKFPMVSSMPLDDYLEANQIACERASKVYDFRSKMTWCVALLFTICNCVLQVTVFALGFSPVYNSVAAGVTGVVMVSMYFWFGAPHYRRMAELRRKSELKESP